MHSYMRVHIRLFVCAFGVVCSIMPTMQTVILHHTGLEIAWNFLTFEVVAPYDSPRINLSFCHDIAHCELQRHVPLPDTFQTKYKEQGTCLVGKTTKDRAMANQWLEVEAQNFNPTLSAIVLQMVLAPVGDWRLMRRM